MIDEKKLYDMCFGGEELLHTLHPEIPFEEVEKALGLKLFFWQKTYIAGGGFRRNGKTLAEILRMLLVPDARGYLDFTKRPKSNKEHIFRQNFIQVYSRLVNAGIKTVPVFFDKKQLHDFLNKGVKDDRREKVTGYPEHLGM